MGGIEFSACKHTIKCFVDYQIELVRGDGTFFRETQRNNIKIKKQNVGFSFKTTIQTAKIITCFIVFFFLAQDSTEELPETRKSGFFGCYSHYADRSRLLSVLQVYNLKTDSISTIICISQNLTGGLLFSHWAYIFS